MIAGDHIQQGWTTMQGGTLTELTTTGNQQADGSFIIAMVNHGKY